ncbi:MAG: hypothetical protein V1716_01550 [Candidatus Uhrbacteria bacterium]
MHKKGTILVEAMVAIGLSVLFISALMTFYLTGTQGNMASAKREQALFYAEEGLQAVRSLSFSDISATETGKLSFVGNKWLLASGSPETLTGNFTRSLQITSATRSETCELDPVGIIIDPDTFEITSTVNWTDATGSPRSVSLTSLRTNWVEPTGPCFAPEQASRVSIDFSDASWYGGRDLRDVYIINNGTSDVIVDKVQLTWNNDHKIQQVFFDTDAFWSSSGAGTPDGDQISNTILNGTDETIGGGITEMKKIKFNSSMSGATMTISLIFSDGSIKTSGEFTPD